MLPYVFLLGFIFIVSFCSRTCSNPKRRNIFLFYTFVYLYIFCSIRSFDVGRDIPGYIQEYEITASVSWDNWTYVYFENGYIALMKICNIIGLSARGFFFVVYAIILFPIYLLIKKLSPYPLLSVIIFISFQFFIFDLTGLRQAIGMSICMLAYLIASEKYTRKRLICFILLVALAATFHKSALIFFLSYIIIRMPLNRRAIIIYCIIALICFSLNIAVVRELTFFFEKKGDYSEDAKVGFLGVALCLIVFWAVWTYYHTPAQKRKQIRDAANMLLASICFLLLFNGNTLLRATMYYYFPMIIALPMYVDSLKEQKLRMIAYAGIAAIFLTYFFTSEVYSFDAMPYTIGKDLL